MSRVRNLRTPCPGSPAGPCPERRRLIASSKHGRCAQCRLPPGPAAAPAEAEVVPVELEQDGADIALARLRPLCRPELRLVISGRLLDQLMLSCYRQGFVDHEQIAQHEARAWARA